MISFIKVIFLIYIYRMLKTIFFKNIYKFKFILRVGYQRTLHPPICQ